MSAITRTASALVTLSLGTTLIATPSAAGQSPSEASGPGRLERSSTAKLALEHIAADSTAFNVLATLVIGPTEVLLWDTQYHLADARRVADRIAVSGKRLKAIVLSHPDHDHYMGAATIVERFPGTPVYMTAKALEEYKRTAPQAFRGEKSRSPQILPDSIVTPQPLPSNRLTIDGETLEVIPDVTGDVISATNSMLWIPSLRTVLASDVVFHEVHAWLGSSDEASRGRWRESLKRIAALRPQVVVAGHKKDVNAPDAPAIVNVMDRYLADFDSLRKASTSAPALFQAMKAKYPGHVVSGLLRFAAQSAYGSGPPGTFDDAVIRPELTAVNKAWSAVRLSYDSATAERLLTPDFYVLLNGQRIARQDFIGMVSQREGPARLVRFDNPILSISKDPAKDEYVATVLEKLEYERPRQDGSGADKMYSLWITRDGYRRVGSGWQLMYSEAISSQSWPGKKPPFPDW